MIALNETNEYAAEVPFNLPLSSDPLTGLTGHSFTLGEVQVKLPGGSWTDAALSKIVEKGYGRYAVRLTAAQCTTAGDVFLRAVVATTQGHFGGEVIGTLGGDVPQAGTGSVYFYLPDEVDPFGNPPLTGHTFVLGQVRMCLPDATYQDVPLAQIEEVGFGGYKVNLLEADTAKKGKVYIYADVTGYQPFEGYATILGTGVATDADAADPVAIPAPIVFGDPEYRDQLLLALSRLPQQFRSGTFVYEGGMGLDGVLNGGL